jgi:pyruvate/2-oxoglutarate/acetoin dehydrogenase E1 component
METIIASVAKTGRLVTVEEGNPTGGIGSEVIARVAVSGAGLLVTNPVRITAPECPIPYARNLENSMIPDPEAVAEEIERMLSR